MSDTNLPTQPRQLELGPESHRCVSCGEVKVVLSALLWQEHEGFTYLTICKDLTKLHAAHPAPMCLMCSMKILNGLMKLEVDVIDQMLQQE